MKILGRSQNGLIVELSHEECESLAELEHTMRYGYASHHAGMSQDLDQVDLLENLKPLIGLAEARHNMNRMLAAIEEIDRALSGKNGGDDLR